MIQFLLRSLHSHATQPQNTKTSSRHTRHMQGWTHRRGRTHFVGRETGPKETHIEFESHRCAIVRHPFALAGESVHVVVVFVAVCGDGLKNSDTHSQLSHNHKRTQVNRCTHAPRACKQRHHELNMCHVSPGDHLLIRATKDLHQICHLLEPAFGSLEWR